MYIDIDSAQKLVFDVCIVGSGPSGIILALELEKIRPDWRVLIVECELAPARKNDLDDTIVISNVLNHHEPYECTNKAVGGSSMTWGGRCVMYDRIDFMDRPILQGQCTWDESLYDELKAYLAPAADYFKCGKPVFDLKDANLAALSSIAEGFQSGLFSDTRLERWSLPTRFGKEYRAALERSSTVSVLLNTLCDRIEEPNHVGNVPSICVCRERSRGRFYLHARQFVLSPGAQEATRLLLKSEGLFSRLSRAPVALGKFYQSHVSGKIASVVFDGDPKLTDFGFIRDDDGVYVRRRFQMSDEALLRENLLNIAFWLDNPLYHDPSHGSGPMSLIYLAMISPVIGKRLLPPAISRSITKGVRFGVGGHLKNVLRRLPSALMIPAAIGFKRFVPRRKLPGVFLYSKSNEYALHFHAEQLPLERNKMTYDAARGTLGIEYAVSDAEAESVVRSHQRLDEWLRACGCGRLRYWYPESELNKRVKEGSRDGIHQNGTTRIADSPEMGVVDRNLRVFGTNNLYVCSTSTFPTSSQANPTFLLGVFSVRLAHLLARQ